MHSIVWRSLWALALALTMATAMGADPGWFLEGLPEGVTNEWEALSEAEQVAATMFLNNQLQRPPTFKEFSKNAAKGGLAHVQLIQVQRVINERKFLGTNKGCFAPTPETKILTFHFTGHPTGDLIPGRRLEVDFLAVCTGSGTYTTVQGKTYPVVGMEVIGQQKLLSVCVPIMDDHGYRAWRVRNRTKWITVVARLDELAPSSIRLLTPAGNRLRYSLQNLSDADRNYLNSIVRQ